MSDKAKIKKEVTIVLRALLLSAPLGLTAVEIERDFREAEGRSVPFRELGYNSTSDLVEDLPEVATCNWERGHAVFHGIADKTTKHIKSLVARQNVDVKKCLKRRNAIERQVSKSGRSYSSSAATTRGRAQPYSRSGWGGKGGSASTGKRTNSYPPSGPVASRRQHTKTFSIPPSIPAYLRAQMKSLLTSHPNGILNTHFDSIFSRKFGFQIDYPKLGMSGVADVVKSLSALISVEHLGEDKFRIYSRENFPKGIESEKSNLPTPLMSQPRVIPRYIPEDAAKPIPFQPPSPNKNNSAFFVATGSGRASRRLPPGKTSEATSHQPAKNAMSPRDPSPQTPGNELIDSHLCEEIQQVLSRHPEGIFAANLPSEYKTLTKKELPLISIGFYSVVELVSAIPEIVGIERQKKNSDWKLFDARTYTAANSPEPEPELRRDDPMSSDSADDSRLAEEKRKVRDVLLAHPTGVLLQHLSSYYEKFFKKPLPCEDFGVSDVNSLVLAIPDTIKVVYSKNKVYLHAQDQGFPHTGVSYSAITKSIPADAIGYGYSFHPAKRPKLNEYFPIWVSTVYTPHKISIQIKDKEANAALEKLMDELESVYHYREGEKYLMPDTMIAVNQICCALYHEDNNWHRGLITGVPNIDLVQVLYVDYGTSVSVPKNSLRLLKSCFMHLPIQAIDAKLAGIQPPGDKWSTECRDRLLELSYDKPLLAYAVEETRAAMSLLLCDTSTDEDIHINDLLVSEGLAKFVEEIKPEPATQTAENAIEPPTSEMTLEMLTGIGLPVPDDDPYQAFQWEDESREVQQIMGTGPSGDGQDIDTCTLEKKLTEAAKPPGMSDQPKEDGSGDSGPPPLESGGEVVDKELEDMAKELSEIEETTSNQVPWTVMRIELVIGGTLHLISFGGRGQYVTSIEIVHLIWNNHQDENALFDLIEQKASELGQVIVEEIDNEDLANSLAGEGVPLSPKQPSRLQLFIITSLPSLLHVSGHVRPDLIQQITDIAQEMPPLEDDDFSRESVSSETSGSADVDIDLAELSKMHDVLRIRRERILKDLMSNTGVGNVDDLMHIERLMKEIEEKLERGRASRGTATNSIDDLSVQFSQSSLGSSISLAPPTPDDVFSSPQAGFPSNLLSPDLNTRDTHSQTVGYGPSRHVSDRTGMSHKQTAMIPPVQRHSTGTAPQKGVGRGVSGFMQPTGIGRGTPKNVSMSLQPLPTGLQSLNPNVPEFVPSPKYDSDSSDVTAPPNILKPPSSMVGHPFTQPPPSLPPHTMPPLANLPPPIIGRGVRTSLIPPPMPFPPTKPLIPIMRPLMNDPNFPHTNLIGPDKPPLPPTSLIGQCKPPLPTVPPTSLIDPGNMGFMPPLDMPPFPPPNQNNVQGLQLPADFTLMPPPPLFDPNVPPPNVFGIGRGSQKWSVNE